MADKPDKSNKLKARLPRGLGDRGPAEIAATRRMLETIRAVYERYGFEPVETPAIEYTDALGKFLPDQDRPNEGVFSFQDDDEQWLSLRYDLTAPLARYVAENFDALPKPYRSYREGFVFRNEKPGPGRFRQFMQFDADTVGSASPAADAEICMMAADTMEALGIPRGSYVVKVNNRKVLDGVLEAIGLGGEANAGKRLIVLRAVDKLDRLGIEGVKALLGPGRKDESGDFTKGAGLEGSAIDRVLDAISAQAGDSDVVLAKLNLKSSNLSEEGVSELRSIAELVRAAGYDDDRIKIDASVVRGLEYYTGPVYEVELTFPDRRRGRKARSLRLGRGRRALRRIDCPLSRRAGAGDRVLHRGVAPDRSAATSRQDRHQARAGAGGRDRVSRRADRGISALGRAVARRRVCAGKEDPCRALSRLREVRGADEICRQAWIALRRDPGRQ